MPSEKTGNRTLLIVLAAVGAAVLAVVVVCGGALFFVGLMAKRAVDQAANNVQQSAVEVRARNDEKEAELERQEAGANLNLDDPRSVLAYTASYRTIDVGNPLVTGGPREQQAKYMEKVVGKKVAWQMPVDTVLGENKLKLGSVDWIAPDKTLCHITATPEKEEKRKYDIFTSSRDVDVRSLRRGSLVTVVGTVSKVRVVNSIKENGRVTMWYLAEIPDGQILPAK